MHQFALLLCCLLSGMHGRRLNHQLNAWDAAHEAYVDEKSNLDSYRNPSNALPILLLSLRPAFSGRARPLRHHARKESAVSMPGINRGKNTHMADTSEQGLTFRYVSGSGDRRWSSDYSHPNPANDYDYSLPTSVNHRVEGMDLVGTFANIRATLDYDYHGNYSPERQKFQDIIIQDSIGGGIVHDNPWIIFSAGAMGAGKGHTIEWMSMQGHFPLTDIRHVDPDRFRTELPEWKGYLERDPERAGYMTRRESGYCVEIAQEAAMQQNKNVWIDGSLRDAEWYSQVFKDIRKRYPHYRIAIIHIFASWEVVCRRAASRAQKTGRVVPEVDLRQSFEEVPNSVAKLAPLADFSAHIDNDDIPRLTTSCIGAACSSNYLMDWQEIRSRFAFPHPSFTFSKIRSVVNKLIETHSVLVFSKTYCSYCKRVQQILLDETQASNIHVVELDTMTLEGGDMIELGTPGAAGVAVGLELARMTEHGMVPQVYIGGSHVGGCDAVEELQRNGLLASLLANALDPAPANNSS